MHRLLARDGPPGLWWVSERLYSGDYATESVTHLARDAFEPGVADAPHCDHRIDRRHLDLTVLETLHDDVAGQHDADMRLFAQRLEGAMRVARAEDAVGLSYAEYAKRVMKEGGEQTGCRP